MVGLEVGRSMPCKLWPVKSLHKSRRSQQELLALQDLGDVLYGFFHAGHGVFYRILQSTSTYIQRQRQKTALITVLPGEVFPKSD